MQRFAVALACLLAPMLAAAASASCPTPALCKPLAAATEQCKHNPPTCSTLITLMQQVEPRYDCKRNFDKAPVPAIWLCGDDFLEHALDVLGHSPDRQAKNYFCSKGYTETLDGGLAETHDAVMEDGVDGGPPLPFYKGWTHCNAGTPK